MVGVSPSEFSPLTPAYGNDGEASDPSRTREGHIEVVEMGEISGVVLPGTSNVRFDQAVTHANGVPADCNAVVTATAPGGSLVQPAAPVNGLLAPTGGLTGGVSLINVAHGVDYSYNAIALTRFRSTSLHSAPQEERPSLGDAEPRESWVFDEVGTLSRSTWYASGGNAADPVTAVLMTNGVLNEFVLDDTINAATDWVLAMPTKRFYVGAAHADRPYSNLFGPGGSCEVTFLAQYDREERAILGAIPPSADPRFVQLCWSTNVSSFNGSKALGTSTLWSAGGVSTGFRNGGASQQFVNQALTADFPSIDFSRRRIVDDSSRAFIGWPVIGFGAQKYVNGNLGGVLANYGGTFAHAFVRALQ